MTDFIFIDHGSVVGFTPLTDEAREWMDEHVAAEGWQWMGKTLMVDQRQGWPYLEAIEGECFDIKEG